MTAASIVLTGAKGGQGTTTTAAALALFASTDQPTDLVAAHPVDAATALGTPPPSSGRPVAVTPNLDLAAADDALHHAHIVIVDAGATTAVADDRPDGLLAAPHARRYLVVRGPCYLALSAVLRAPGPPPDGVILVAEEGRTLTATDVADVLDLPVVATIAATPRVARTIDAGLLPTRYRRLTELAQLRALADSLTPDPVPHPHPSTSLATTCTDLPFSKSRTSDGGRGVAIGPARCTYLRRGHRHDRGARPMLNIGRLAPGAADYYCGEVATSAEEYYTGRGESAGRWVGSLAPKLGLAGAVDADDFRAVLAGRHPRTHEQLAPRGTCPRPATAPNQPTLFDRDALDVARVATRLRLHVSRVRQLLWAGDRARQGGKQPDRYLVGYKARLDGQRGRDPWLVPKAEVERYEAEHGSRRIRPGYDITLRPPKSVSVLWALADDAERRAIRDAHQEAVDSVVTYLERHAVYARRGNGDRAPIETDGLVAAAFDHRTSRAGDPLLHTHVVCANLTYTAEGRWQAIDGRPLYAHGKPAGCLYQAHLRHALTRRLGVAWTAVRNGWAEIDGVPQTVIRAFSKRRDEIEEMVAESGYTSARAHQAATLATRRAKDHGTTADRLAERWQAEAAQLGFGPAEVAACFTRQTTPAEPELDALFGRLAGPVGLTRHPSTFARRDVVEALAGELGSAASAERIDQLADQFLATGLAQPLAPAAGSSDIVHRRGGIRTRSVDLTRWSTPELINLERQLLDHATNGLGTPVPAATPASVAAALAARPELSPEQRHMVHAVARRGSAAIQVVAGRPGSGKTHALAAAAEALTVTGVPVVGCALSATAAAELEASANLQRLTGRPASTIARLLLDLRRDPLPTGAVLVVDEASMVGTRDLAALASHVAAAGGAITLVGDPDQHGAVETGGAFQALARQHPDAVVHLTENRRQHDPRDREAIDIYRSGRVETALGHYDDTGRIVRSPTAAASYDAIVSDWHRNAGAGGTDPMIAGPNATRTALNQRARARLIDDGHITGPSIDAAGRHYARGDWVVARKNAPWLKGTAGFVKNGSAGTIVAVDTNNRSLVVAFHREGVIQLPAGYLDDGHLDYGYARTTYGVQGATLQHALYHAGDASSFEEGYVALSRGRIETRIYLVDGTAAHTDPDTAHPAHDIAASGLDTVAQAMNRRRANSLAHDTDPTAAAIAELASWTLAEVQAERRRLEAILDNAPPDVSSALLAASQQRDKLLAQRLAWTAKAAGTRRAHGRRKKNAARAQEELSRIDAALANVDAKIVRLRERHADRRRFLETHQDEAEQLRLIRGAESSRRLHTGLSAVAHPAQDVIATLGNPPDDPAARQQWHAAVETIANHRAAHGEPATVETTSDPVAKLLGERPVDPAARWSYDRSADLLRDALPEAVPDPDFEPAFPD